MPDSIRDYELSKFDSREKCYHNGFMLCYSPTDCSIKYVSGNDVVYVHASHLDIQGKRAGQNPQIMDGVIYDVDLYTNTADMSFPTDAFNSDCGMIVAERDETTKKLERYFVPKHKIIGSDYNIRLKYAKGDPEGLKKPGLVVDLSNKPMFSFRTNPEEHIRVPSLMQRIGNATRKKYYMDLPSNHIDDTAVQYRK